MCVETSVAAHGYVRLTRAVDLVLRIEPKNVLRGMGVLYQTGCLLAALDTAAEIADEAVRERWRPAVSAADFEALNHVTLDMQRRFTERLRDGWPDILKLNVRRAKSSVPVHYHGC